MGVHARGAAGLLFILFLIFFALGVYLSGFFPDQYKTLVTLTCAIGGPATLFIICFLMGYLDIKKLKEEEERIKYFICPQCNIKVEKDPGICPKCGKNLSYSSNIIAE